MFFRSLFLITSLIVIIGCGDPELKTEITETWPNGSKKKEISYYRQITDPRRVVIYNVKGGIMSDRFMKGGKPDSLQIGYNLDGSKFKEECYIQKEDGTPMLHGKASYWYENGQLKSEAVYDSGAPSGTIIAYYDDGNKMSETSYKNGKKDGEDIVYFKNGNKKKSTIYLASRRSGTCQEWFENGKLKEVNEYKDNALHGTTIVYYSNGKKRREINYQDGQLHGLKTEWNKRGRKVAQAKYEKGEATYEERF